GSIHKDILLGVSSIGAELLQTDKSGKFAILPQDVLRRKKEEAVSGVLVPFEGNLKKLKSEVVRVFKSSLNDNAAKKIVSVSKDLFSVKFLCKDHKPEFPLRIVINEGGTWQKLLSSFLQSGLELLTLNSSIRIV